MHNFIYGFTWGLGFFLACIVVSLCCGLILCLLVSLTDKNIGARETIKEEDADM